jgi:GT2 family glycosyltransferase
MSPPAPVTVVVPTIGRPELLRSCLESLVRCDPQADEILVVDQSSESMARVVETWGDANVRLVPCARRGIAIGTNLGLRQASHEVVMVTHDDCTVAPDWIITGWQYSQALPAGIHTGRVLPFGDPYTAGEARVVPSIKTDEHPADYTGHLFYGVLYPANMVLPRSEVLAMGGFDERPSLSVAAEDNDLCYRWLKSGRILRYEPDLVVWHHDWRSPPQLERLYVAYARGQGAFYAKHLRDGDLLMVRFILADLARGARSVAGGFRHRRPRWTDERRGLLRGLPAGILAGWREAGRLKRSASPG